MNNRAEQKTRLNILEHNEYYHMHFQSHQCLKWSRLTPSKPPAKTNSQQGYKSAP